jgi:hypothetical protein
MAKPSHFRLKYEQNKFRSNKWGWVYSFSGHRFNAFDDDPYVQVLAQLHHEYSVEGITKNMARLRLTGDAHTMTVAENLPLDLYALEMCDQIEATLARSVLEHERPEERVFMDFQIRVSQDGVNTFEIEPFSFLQEPVQLEVEYAEIIPPAQKIEAVKIANDNNRRAILREIENWLIETLQTQSLQYQEVTLWPWSV